MARLRLEKWGNSVGLRLPKHVLEGLGLEAGSFVNVTLDNENVWNL
ncbi:MAG: AbrB/MazE/SpoVT family DNA-binding domain-containing protein [Synergistaceae bacterium]|nr:AbrB/MazE/SpoVT family DNA-binding domain-containing protein [Synergistaceae bacterium]